MRSLFGLDLLSPLRDVVRGLRGLDQSPLVRPSGNREGDSRGSGRAVALPGRLDVIGPCLPVFTPLEGGWGVCPDSTILAVTVRTDTKLVLVGGLQGGAA